MSSNKNSSPRKNGFINILFNKASTIDQRQTKTKDSYQFHKFIEDHVFIPRNKVKHVKILKMNETIYTNFNSLKADHLRKIFVDGSHLRELTPQRNIATHGATRINREQVGSRQIYNKRNNLTKKNLSYYQECKQYSKESVDYFENRQAQTRQVMIMSMRQKDYQQQTNTSSNRNIRVTVRYKRVQNKKQSEDKKQLSLELKKQLFRFYSNPPRSPEDISAKSYIIYQHKIQKNQDKFHKYLHTAFNTKINLQIASLTKIMTCLIVLEICERYKIDFTTKSIKIDQFQTKVQGTSASIQPEEIYTVQQLLYGLMLPSGNDASLALSVFCGQLLQKDKKLQFQSSEIGKKHYYRKFIMEMNKKCIQLGMQRTIYSNSHGLPNVLNKSCASDLIILVDYALRNQKFRKIVKSPAYSLKVYKAESNIQYRNVKWQNTHKLVLSNPQMYLGIKTGTTEAAGPCLASLITAKGREFIIVVLNSKSSKWRYKDTQSLREWLFAKEKL